MDTPARTAAVEPRIRLSVLGPMQGWRDGAPAELGGTLQRRLLALLAAASGQVVPADDLLEEVWGSAGAGRSSFHACISRLRRALDVDGEESAIQRLGTGYALRLPADAVDADRFVRLAGEGEAALRRGNVAAARDLLTGALGLWRGPAYADVVTGTRLTAAAAHLDEVRRTAEDALLAARVEAGEAASVIADLERRVRDPHASENVWALLATAMYRAGRQAEALDALRRARRHLVDELGLDPGPQLQDLEVAILRHDPALLDVPETATVTPPAPRSAEAVPAETPPLPLTSFVGRRDELARLERLLDDARLVTLLGSGGAGKTRLALEAVHRTPPGAAELAWVALGTVRHEGLVVQAIADAIGVTTLGAEMAPGLLVPSLRQRHVLLVLDNCEHLVDEVSRVVAELLAACPPLRVLATSREELRVPGEVLLDVRPLAVDGGGGAGEAVELFCSRAVQHVPDHVLRGDGLPVVRQICRDLDGVPLAIELAAARLRTLSLTELRDALADRFAVLTNGPRTGLPHHRTLRETVAWSYELLAPREQEAFRRLAVLDGFRFEDGVRVLGTADAVTVLHELAAKSLVVVDKGGRVPRWGMLETLRVFAASVASPEETAESRARLLDWVASLAEAARPHLRGPHAAEWIARLHAEQANIRQALGWAFDHGHGAEAAAVVAALPWFWYRRGHTAEGRAWLDRALPHATEKQLRGELLHGIAMMGYLDGDIPAAGAAIEEAGLLIDEETDPDLHARLLGHIGYFRALSGDLPGALEAAREGLRIAETAGIPQAEAEALMTLGQLARFTDVTEAARVLERAAELAFAHDATWVALSSQWIGAKVALSTGQAERAIGLMSHGLLAMGQERDDTSFLACLQVLAGAVAAGGDGALGARLLGACDGIGERIGYSPARMDPLDSPWIRELVTGALDPVAYGEAYADGMSLGFPDVARIAARLAEPDARRPEHSPAPVG